MLTENVFPPQMVPQWVCSLPWKLRSLLGYDKAPCAKVLAAFTQEVGRSLSRRAKHSTSSTHDKTRAAKPLSARRVIKLLEKAGKTLDSEFQDDDTDDFVQRQPALAIGPAWSACATPSASSGRADQHSLGNAAHRATLADSTLGRLAALRDEESLARRHWVFEGTASDSVPSDLAPSCPPST